MDKSNAMKDETEKASTSKSSSQKNRQETKAKRPQGGANLVDIVIDQMVKEKYPHLRMNPTMTEIAPCDQGLKSSEDAVLKNQINPELIETMRENYVLRKQIFVSEEQVKSLEVQLETEKSDRQIIHDRMNTVEQGFEVLKRYEDYVTQTLMDFQQHAGHLKEVYDGIISPQQDRIEELEKQIAELNIEDKLCRITELENSKYKIETQLENLKVRSEEESNLLKEKSRNKEETLLLKIQMLETSRTELVNEIQTHEKRITELKVNAEEDANLLRETSKKKEETSLLKIKMLETSNGELVNEIEAQSKRMKDLENSKHEIEKLLKNLEEDSNKSRETSKKKEESLLLKIQMLETTKMDLVNEIQTHTKRITELENLKVNTEEDSDKLRETSKKNEESLLLKIQMLETSNGELANEIQAQTKRMKNLENSKHEIEKLLENIKVNAEENSNVLKETSEKKEESLLLKIKMLETSNKKLVNEIQAQTKRMTDLENSKFEIENQLEILKTHADKDSNLLNEKSRKTDELLLRIQQLNKLNAESMGKITTLENEMQILNEKHEEDAGALEATIANQRSEMFTMEKAFQKLSSSNTHLLKEHDELKQQRTDLEISKNQQDGTFIEELRSKNRELLEKCEMLKQAKINDGKKIIDLEKNISTLKVINSGIQNELESQRQKYVESCAGLTEKNKLLEEYNVMTKSKASETDQLKSIITKQDANYSKLVNDMSALKTENQILLEKNCNLEKHEQGLIDQLKQDISSLKSENKLLKKENVDSVKSEENFIIKMKRDMSTMKVENQALTKKNHEFEKQQQELLHKLKLQNIAQEKMKKTCHKLEEQLKSTESRRVSQIVDQSTVTSPNKSTDTQTMRFKSVVEESTTKFDESHKKVYTRYGRDKKSVSIETPKETPVPRIPCYSKRSLPTLKSYTTAKKNPYDFLTVSSDDEDMTPDEMIDKLLKTAKHGSQSLSQKSYKRDNVPKKTEGPEKTSTSSPKSNENKFFKSKKPPMRSQTRRK